MLSLTSLNCGYILASSPYLDDILSNPCDYDRIEITAKKNCCDTTVYTEVITIPTTSGCLIDDWIALLPVSDTLKVHSIKFKNIITGTEFDITLGLDIDGTSDLQDVTTLIDTYFHDHFGSSTGAITSTQSVTSTEYTYTLLGIPETFAPISFDYSIDNIHADLNFNYITSTKNTLYNASGIVFTPTLINNTTFLNGIYQFTITAFKLSGSRVSESNCIFLDCTLKCDLSDRLSALSSEDQIEVLMLHHGLVQGSNCACDCNTLCTLYGRLYSIVYNTQIPNTCGC